MPREVISSEVGLTELTSFLLVQGMRREIVPSKCVFSHEFGTTDRTSMLMIDECRNLVRVFCDGMALERRRVIEVLIAWLAVLRYCFSAAGFSWFMDGGG